MCSASPRISVVVPSYRPEPELLERLYASLLAQSEQDFEVILVDDASGPTADYALISDPRFRVVRRARNAGPAACRNAGVAEARAEQVFFTDTDCELAPEALRQACAALEADDAAAGNTITRASTVFGKAVALLGFPGGGSIGFDRVWRVDAAGHARSFSSCNVAFRKDAFLALGGFNERFPVPGGEDTVLARRLVDAGRRIRYCPEQIVYHVEKSDWASFVRWQVIRGRGNHHIRRHVPEVGGYLRLRVWTFKNSLIQAGPLYAPLVLFLIAASVWYQLKGMRAERRRLAEEAAGSAPRDGD